MAPAPGMVELPAGLVALGSAYIGLTVVLGLAISLATAPLLIINRRKSAYFDDWNDALRAPWLFWHIGGLWFRLAELLGNYVLPAPQRVTDLASGFMRSAVVITVNELGVPDALADGPQTGAQLAARLGVQQAYLERVLRVAERMQLVSLRPAAPQAAAAAGSSAAPAYHLTQLSAVLCERHCNSVKHMVSLFGDHFGAFAHLTDGVRTGQTPYRLYAGGKTHWEHMTAQPELYSRFNKAMTNFNNLCPIEAVFREYDFRAYERLVDVGGGLGAFTAAAMAAAPQLRGEVFDLPHVIKQAQQVWHEQRASLLPRVAFVGGSFFEPGQLPAARGGAEVYVLRQILHDWSDADSLKILQQVRAAIGEHRGARLVIVEACLAARLMTSTHTPRACGDVHMLVQYGDAKERSDDEFAQLLARAGFRLTRLLPTKSLFFVLEAEPL